MLRIIQSLLAKSVSPTACSVCGAEGFKICRNCFIANSSPKISTCYRCNRLSSSFKTCRACRSSTPLKQVFIASRYEGLIRELILMVKHEPSRLLAAELGWLLSDILPNDSMLRDFAVTWVPASRSGILGRGFDQSEVMARRVSVLRGLKCAAMVARKNITTDSRKLSGSERRARHKDGLVFIGSPPLNAAGVLIIDDVVTTGSSIESVAQIISESCPGMPVYGLVVAKTAL